MDMTMKYNEIFNPKSYALMGGLSEKFTQDSFLILPDDFFTDKLKDDLELEARALLSTHAEHRKLEMKITGNTPRNYMSVGRDMIYKNNKSIRKLFESDSLLMVLSTLAQEPVFRVPYAAEEYIINNQCGVGHTHGWHWDDYSFAMIHVVEAPDPMHGGQVEFVPNIHWDKSDPSNCIRSALQENVVLSCYVAKRKTYFMRTNTTLHRVSPLTGATNRIAIIVSFASAADMNNHDISHETMEIIYPKDTQNPLEVGY